MIFLKRHSLLHTSAARTPSPTSRLTPPIHTVYKNTPPSQVPYSLLNLYNAHTGIHTYTRACAHAPTCAHTCAPSVRWGEIRRTSRCDTPYHWSRYAVSLFGVPRTPSRKRGSFRQNFRLKWDSSSHTLGSAVRSTPSSPPETQRMLGDVLATSWSKHG